jgi:hypothetical protein
LELEKTLLELSSAQEMILSCFKKKETWSGQGVTGQVGVNRITERYLYKLKEKKVLGFK